MALKKILITTGDTDGVGFEVAAKALSKVGPQKNFSFFIWRNAKPQKKFQSLLAKKFKVVSVRSLSEALAYKTSSSKQLIEIVSEESPALWVEESAQACFEKRADALVTGPLSKPEIFRAGLNDLGHTDILKRISGSKNATMSFWGKHFRVLLTTGHIPIAQIESKLTTERLDEILKLAIEAKSRLPKALAKRPIAILGLNPHAGDSGLIGDFEQKTLIPWMEKNKSANLVGPLVPDAAFHKDNWNKYSFYIALYHDQGLIPFKTIHGFAGVHVTLGLPLVRSSVDHGTAKELFGKNKADPTSMMDAIKWAMGR